MPHFEHIYTRGHAVHSICRDAEGVVWVGTTNGLTTLAQLKSNNPFSYTRHEALNQLIDDIKKDNTGRLWLLTHANHILVYDPHRNSVITDVDSYLKSLNIPYVNERLTIIGPQGKLWTSNAKSVVCYDFKEKTTRNVPLPAKSGDIIALHSNGDDVFVVTQNNIFCIATPKNIAENIGTTPYPIKNNDFILKRDMGKNLWLAIDNRLLRLDRKTKEWREINDIKNVKGIVATIWGHIFVATTNYGLYEFLPGSTQPLNFRQAPPNTNGLLTNHIEAIYYSETLDAMVVTYYI